MKKLHFLVLTTVLILSACSKSEIQEKEREKGALFVEITQIAEQEILDINGESQNLKNEINPFDFVGEVVANVSTETIGDLEKGVINPDSVIVEYRKKLEKNLSSKFYLDTSNFDLAEIEIFEILTKIYIKDGYNSFVAKSKLIEKSLINSCYFNDIQKQRVLIYSSTLRHIAGVIKNYSNAHKSYRDETLEECFRKKLEALQGCKECFFEKLICILSFPECLGIKFLDCLIYIIIQALF